jgi:hypothetical protein
MASRRCADWRFPTEKQARAEETARVMQQGVRKSGQESDFATTSLPYQDTVNVRNVRQDPDSVTDSLHPDPAPTSVAGGDGPDSALPNGYWAAILEDPRAAGKPWLPVSQMRLSEIPRELLRVECLRCFRTVEIQRLDAIKLYGPHAIWKDVGNRLLDDGCKVRTGRHEEDGCWPDLTGK